jgi:hypothetical protein
MFRSRLARLLAPVLENRAHGEEKRYKYHDTYSANLDHQEIAKKMGLPVDYVEDLCTPKFKKIYPAARGRASKPGDRSSSFSHMFPRYKKSTTQKRMLRLGMKNISTQ